jgi:transmembrane sensor
MKPSSKSLDPAVRKLLADAEATPADGPTKVEHDPALLKALAEASAWIVTLHGPNRSAAVERGFQHWLAESSVHQYAFEHATETWSKTRATVRRSAHVDVSAPQSVSERPARKKSSVIFAMAASLLIAAIGAAIYIQQAGLETGIGERRTVVLDDGTQVTLNTATQMFVDYDKHQRRVRLESGEAFFEVAKHPEWPFVVTAGDRKVTALGTAFLVRRDAAKLAITLVEGKVAVSSSDEAAFAGGAATANLGEANAATTPSTSARGDVPLHEPQVLAAHTANLTLTLTPGQRVIFAEREAPVLDRPVLGKLTAWQQGLVNIDDLTLAQAAAEMNRYSRVLLVVEGPAAQIRVSGVFRVTDSENLAKAVALTHGLEMRREGRRIVLSGIPQPPNDSRFGHSLHQVGEAR